jgi:hypothetical protein
MICPKYNLASLLLIGIALISVHVSACTVFSAAGNGIILTGNNEDWYDPTSKICFNPREEGKYGRFVFRDLYGFPQGGMNECGLFYDIAAAPDLAITSSLDKIPISGRDILTKCLEECSTVREVLRLFDRYNLTFMEKWQILFADSTGASVIIEGDQVIRKAGNYQVMTNFSQSITDEPYSCPRYNTATGMLANSTELTSGLFRDICDATHQVNDWPTQYSNICDLKNRIIYLYHNHDFENVVRIDLLKVLAQGESSHLISAYMELAGSREAAHGNPFKLYPNYPNPFNVTTTISFSTPIETEYTFRIYNSNGGEVMLLENQKALPGVNRLHIGEWDLLPGHYVYSVETPRNRWIGKMLRIR